MPDRIIRANILTSDPVNTLSWAAEVFYRRMMSIVDDFGRYDGRLEILRGQLYSLKLSKVSTSDIVKWMDECSKAGLIRVYQVDGKDYVEILKFGQRLRVMKSKWPDYQDGGHLLADVSNVLPETKRNETESETETSVPPVSEFLDYCKEFLKDQYPGYEFSLKSKYEAWVADGWKDGNKKKITNWKTKIKNTVPYLKTMQPQNPVQTSQFKPLPAPK